MAIEKHKYKQVKSLVYDDYIHPKLQQGGKMPSKQRLASKYKVNVGTLDKALQELVLEGFIEKRRGSGTYILPREYNKIAAIGIYFLVLREYDARVSSYSYRLLDMLIERLSACDLPYRYYADVRPETMLHEPLPQLTEDIANNKLAALLVVRSDCNYDDWLNVLPLPRIGFDRDFGWGTVSYDKYQSGYEAGRFLIATGCRRIELISVYDKEWERDKLAQYFMRHVRAGMTNAMLEMDLPAPKIWLTPDKYPESLEYLHYSYDDSLRGYELAKQLFTICRPDGLVVFTDVIAVGVVRAVKELGLFPGKDIKIVVLGNKEINLPELTDVIHYDLAVRDVADSMMHLINAAINHKPPETIYISRTKR